MTPFPDRAAETRIANRAMLQEAFRALPLDETLTALTAHIEARPDVDPVTLDAFGNLMCRRSDQIEREARK